MIQFEDAFVRLVEGVASNLEDYRAANVGKFLGEKAGEHMGDFQKLDRYKNRVRVVDCVLPELERFLYDRGILQIDPGKVAAQRIQID